MASTKGFKFLPHITDVRMVVWGRTIQELFQNALKGVSLYLKSPLPAENSAKKERVRVSLEAVDVNSLFVEFLSDIIARSDTENMVFTDVSFEGFGENFLTGEFFGVRVDGFDNEIKAVSYHEVDIKKNPETGFFETLLVFDV